MRSPWDRSDGSSIPPEIVSLFNKILDSDKTFFASARILLMSQLVPLFRLDPQWAKEKLIPLLDWCKSKNCCEVAGCWQAFLWNARLYLPLIDEIKLLLLETLSHYEELQQRKILLLRFLTFILLEGPKKLFEGYDVQNKLMSLPKEAMPSVIRFITNFYESINDEQKLSYWDSRIGYFWRTFWPKDRKFKSEELSKSLVELMLVSNKSFKSAYDLFNASLQPFKYADQEIETLVQKGLCESYPKESWDVLRKILKSPEYVIDPKIVREAFERIASAEPKLKHNKVFKKMQQKY